MESAQEFVFTQAVFDDVDDIYNLAKKESKLLGPVIPPEIKQFVERKNCLVVKDMREDVVIAFVLYTPLKTSPSLTIYSICVDRSYRGKNIAKNMVNYLQNLYNREIQATCIKDTDSENFWSSIACKIYEKEGKKNKLCRYKVKMKRRTLLDGI